jgi:hypothetical protein
MFILCIGYNILVNQFTSASAFILCIGYSMLVNQLTGASASL